MVFTFKNLFGYSWYFLQNPQFWYLIQYLKHCAKQYFLKFVNSGSLLLQHKLTTAEK